MRINIRGIFAKCPECGCEEFQRRFDAQGQHRNLLHCGECGHAIGYDELSQQITGQALVPAKSKPS